MKKVAVYALRKATGAFLILHEHELDALAALPLWFASLFTALLRCADHATGAGSTNYRALTARLQPIQPRTGPRLFAPDEQAVKKAVRKLEERRLLRRDKLHSQDSRCLFFVVDPRYAKSRPDAELEPLTRTPTKHRRASNGAACSQMAPGTRPPNSNPSSVIVSYHSKEAELSTGREAINQRLRETVDQMRGARGVETRAPKGA